MRSKNKNAKLNFGETLLGAGFIFKQHGKYNLYEFEREIPPEVIKEIETDEKEFIAVCIIDNYFNAKSSLDKGFLFLKEPLPTTQEQITEIIERVLK